MEIYRAVQAGKEREEMTPEEAIEILGDFEKQAKAKADGAYQTNVGKMACDMAISALKEIQQYREIGTVEECRKALERRKPKRAVFDCMIGNWEGIFNCPACGKVILRDCGDVENTFCERCGQAIRWG